MPLASRALRAKATIPNAPGTPTVTSYQNGQIPVSWTAPAFTGGAPLTDYTLEYSSNGGSSWTPWSHAAGWTTSATVTGLSNGTSYIFRVAGKNAVGQGAWSSNSASATPATLPSAPGTPTITSQASTQVGLSWTAPASTGGAALSNYLLEYSTNGGTNWSTWTHTAGWVTSVTVTGLTDYLTYIFRVSAINIVGTGSASGNSASAAQFNYATSGGTITDVTNYNGTGQTWRRHVFTGNDTLVVTRSMHPYRILLVGGGGPGSSGFGNSAQNFEGGNGGSGGTIHKDIADNYTFATGNYSVVIGSNGGASTFNSLSATGGGGGNGGGGGCGGGGSGYRTGTDAHNNPAWYGINMTGGAGTSTLGTNGADGNWSGQRGNGGGASTGGTSTTHTTAGRTSTITGASVTYAPGSYGNGGAGGVNGSGGSAGGAGVFIVAYRIA